MGLMGLLASNARTSGTVEVKGVERTVGVPKARLLDAAGDEPVLPSDEFVADERRDEGSRRRGLEREHRDTCLTGIERGPSPPLLTRVASIRFSPFLSGIRFTGIVSSLTRRSSSTGLSLR